MSTVMAISASVVENKFRFDEYWYVCSQENHTSNKLRWLVKGLAGRLTKAVDMLQACGHQEAEDV